METDSVLITSGGFSASITEPHFSNSEMDYSTKSLFFKADWLLWNEAHLGVLKKGNCNHYPLSPKLWNELKVFFAKILIFSYAFLLHAGNYYPFPTQIPEWCNP